MAVAATESKKDITKLLREVLSSARYVVDSGGSKTDVVLSLSTWENLLALLEDLDDRLVVKEWLSRLQAGPFASGALRWEDVSAEWEDDDDTV
jgi:hypothetical protein